MHLNLLDPDKMKTLDEYVVMLVAGIMTLNTLKQFHIKAVSLGIFKPEHETMANTLVWDLNRLCHLYMEQAENLLQLLPDGFSVAEVMKQLSANEITAIKKIKRAKNV